MSAADIGISWIRTQPIYYHPLRFESYKIIHYESKNPKHFESLQKFDDRHRSDYIVGVGQCLDYAKSNYPTGCYEWYMERCKKIDCADFLQHALTTGGRLLLEGEYRTLAVDERKKDIILEFCMRYGLNKEELSDIMVNNDDPPPHDLGCSVWSFIFDLEELVIAQRKMVALMNGQGEHPNITMGSIALDEAKLVSMCLYSVAEKKMKSFLLADSLLDVAFYQLGKVMSDGVLIRKCANPACSQVIVGCRSDKKTCSNACRKALERYQKNRQPGGGAH